MTDINTLVSPVLWLYGRTEDLSLDGTDVTWADSSGEGNDFETFTTGGSLPTIASDGNGVQFNGRSDAGDGSSDLTDFSIMECVNASPALLTAGATAWIVIQGLSSEIEGALLGSYGGEFRTYRAVSTRKVFKRSPFANHELFFLPGETQVGTAGGVVVIQARFKSDDDLAATIDNNPEVNEAFSAVSEGTPTGNYLGCFRRAVTTQDDNPLNAIIREVVVTHDTLDDATRDEVQQILLSRWAGVPSVPETEQEIWAANFADALGAPPQTTALIRAGDAQTLTDHNVQQFINQPRWYRLRVPVQVGELADFEIGTVRKFRANLPGLEAGKLLRIYGRQGSTGSAWVTLLCRG